MLITVKFVFKTIIALNANLDILFNIKIVLILAFNVIMITVPNVKITLDIVKNVFMGMHYISLNKSVEYQQSKIVKVLLMVGVKNVMTVIELILNFYVKMIVLLKIVILVKIANPAQNVKTVSLLQL